MKFRNICLMSFASAFLSLYPIYGVSAQDLSPQEKANVHTVTPIRMALAEGIIFKDAVDEIEDKMDTPLTKAYPSITVLSIPQITKAYSQKGVKADKTYKGKWFLILGNIKGISEDSKNITIKVTSGRKSSANINAQFSKTESLEKQLSKMKVGDPVDLICQATGNDGTKNISLNNCTFFTETLQALYPERYEHAKIALQGTELKQEYASEALVILALEEVLQPKAQAQCLKGAYPCMLTIQPIMEGGDADIPQSYYDLGYTADMLYE